MNKEQQQIIDEAYNNYLNKAKNYTTEDLFYNKLSGVGDVIEGMLSAHTRDFIPYTQEEFINKCKTDPEFSEKWGFKIDERELSEGERGLLLQPLGLDPLTKEGRDRLWKENNLPTKLITITYNNKTITSYK
jgi:hypothetical protein